MGMDNASLAAAVLTLVRRPEFPAREQRSIKIKTANQRRFTRFQANFGNLKDQVPRDLHIVLLKLFLDQEESIGTYEMQ